MPTCAHSVLLQDPHAPRTQAAGSPRAPLGDIRSPHSSGRPISPSPGGSRSSSPGLAALHGGAAAQHHSSPKAAAVAALSSTAVHQLLNRHAPQQQQQHNRQQAAGSVGCAVSGGIRQQRVGPSTDDAAVVDSLLKYNFYRQFGIDPQHVAPYKQEWLQAALALVPQSPPPLVSQVRGFVLDSLLTQKQLRAVATSLRPVPHPTMVFLLLAAAVLLPLQAFYEQLLATSIEEVQDEYIVSQKQAILDYVLASPMERQRLGLDGLSPLLVPHPSAGAANVASSSSSSTAVLRPRLVPASHGALVQRQLPPEWHEHVAMARCVCICRVAS